MCLTSAIWGPGVFCITYKEHYINLAMKWGLVGMGLPFRNQRGPHVGKALGIQASAPT